MKYLTFKQVLDKLGNNVVSHDGQSQVTIYDFHHNLNYFYNNLDEWLKTQGFSYEGTGDKTNSHIYERYEE